MGYSLLSCPKTILWTAATVIKRPAPIKITDLAANDATPIIALAVRDSKSNTVSLSLKMTSSYDLIKNARMTSSEVMAEEQAHDPYVISETKLVNVARQMGYKPSASTSLVERRLHLADFMLKSSGYPTLQPLLPLLLSIRGKPYHLHDHFPFAPFFRTRMARTTLLKTGRQVSKTLVKNSVFNRVYGKYGDRYRFEDIQPGQYVQSFDPTSFKACEQKVLLKHHNPLKTCYYIRTRRGVEMELAGTHPLYTFDGWTTTDKLSVGSRIVHVRKAGVFGNEKVDSRRIKMTAYMIGDGSFRSNYTFTANRNTQAVAEMRVLAGDYWEYDKVSTEAIALRFRRAHPVYRWAKEDGLHNKLSHEKQLPGWVFRLSRADTVTFIERLWATDGMIKPDKVKATITYTSTSRDLVYELKSLLSKFGIPTSIKKRRGAYKKPDGRKVICREYWIIRVETREGWQLFFDTFNVPDKPSFKLPNVAANNNRYTCPIEISRLIAELAGECRGKNRHEKKVKTLYECGLRRTPKYPPSKDKLQQYVDFFRQYAANNPKLAELEKYANNDIDWDEIVEIRSIGERECIDIEVENTHSYLLDGVVSHNSTSLAAQGVLFSNCIPYFSTLFLTPLFEMIRRFSQNYVAEFITTSPVGRLFTDETTVNNVLQRSFKNRSKMIFSFAYLDAERTRGISADKNCIDEIQDMDISFLPVIHETISASRSWGIKQYAGTPKTLDNTIERLWIDSSMAEWIIKCPHGGCGHWNIPSLDHDLLKMIGPVHDSISDTCPGVICAKCAKPINPRPPYQGGTGRWLHRHPDKRWSFAGYHVPQLIMPMHYASREKWQTLVDKRDGKGNTPIHVFYNEVCGESWDSGSKLVTITDLKRAACLPWKNTMETARNNIDGYLYRFVAVDWGGGGVSNGKSDLALQSYTSIAVCGLCPDGRVDVIYGYRSMTPHEHEREAGLILNIMGAFKCSHVVHDYTGAGTVRETLLVQARLPRERILPVAYTGPAKGGLIGYKPANPKHPRDHYVMDRNRALNYCCQFIKGGVIRFFEYDYKGSDDVGLLHDFLNLIEDKAESGSGRDTYKILRDPAGPDDFAQAVTMGSMMLFQMAGRFPDLSAYKDIEISDDVLLSTQGIKDMDWY